MRGRLIERYTIYSTLPYFALALLLLTVVLLAQQATRFAEVLGTARAPLGVAAEVLLGLLPNILVFTLPMALLTGTATGFSRMGSDSELVAMRAAGVGIGRLLAPVLLLGTLVSLLTLYVGLEVSPAAASRLRRAGLRAALYRLESPVEPRTFSVEIPGKVVYVRDGDRETGQWGRVFMHWQEASGVRLITARAGRIDSTGESTELVLQDAVVTTLPNKGEEGTNSPQQVTTERSAQLRIRDDRLNTGREALLSRLREREAEPDEMDWRELSRSARAAPDASDRRRASFALHKRLSLCAAPLVFAFLGASIGLRMGRGGRGLGVLLSLATMIAYYLVALAGEYLVRAEFAPVWLGAWLATAFSACAGAALLTSGRQQVQPLRSLRGVAAVGPPPAEGKKERKGGAAFFLADEGAARRGLFSGLLDRSILRSLTWNFGVALFTLVSVFLVFTLFELLRFIAATGAGLSLVARYMLFLLPLALVSLAPMSVLVGVLVAYALLARRSEAVAWWACGQSAYRLAVPALVFAACAGLGLWALQEKVMPGANRLQNSLRQRIRGGVARGTTQKGRQWLAAPGAGALYSYEYAEGAGELQSPVVYEFDREGVHLSRLVSGERGSWGAGGVLTIREAEVVELDARGGAGRQEPSVTLHGTEPPDVFKPALNNAAEMDIKHLSDYISTLKRRGEAAGVHALSVSLERRRADPFAPLVMALVAVPLALAYGRRSAVAALCAAVGTGLAFWGTTSGLQQLGTYGLLPSRIAAWSPFVIYAAAGLYLLMRART